MRIQPGVGHIFDSSSSGFTLDTSEQFPDRDGVVSGHPFKIVNVALRTSGGSTKVTYQVQSGTINNIVPKIDDYVSSTEVLLNRVTSGSPDPPTAELASSDYDATTKTCYITLRAGIPTAAPFVYPDPDFTSNRYPVIIGGNAVPADENTKGYLLIASISVDSTTAPTTFTVTQYVTGSLWGDRIKLGTDTANYYYARI